MLALALEFVPYPARAGELDLGSSLSGFSSPQNVYGPWRSLTTAYRWNWGPDTPSVTFTTRADVDRLAPTHSNGLNLDDYHDWSRRFFTYCSLSVAGGTVLPTRSIYVEGDGKLGRERKLVIGGGFGSVVNPNQVVQRYVNVGPAFYGTGFKTGRTGTGTGIAVIQAGHSGKTISTLTLLAGDQPPNGIVAPAQSAAFGQRALFAGFGVKHWTSAVGGFVARFEFERLNDRATGDSLYARRGLHIGIFREIGPSLP